MANNIPTKKYNTPLSYFYSSTMNYYVPIPVIPDSISDSTKADWNSQSILGRATPIAAYNYTGARSISFSFEMSRDPNEVVYDGIGNQWSPNKVLAELRALVYPEYLHGDNGGVVAPLATFVFADFKSHGYVENIGFNWKRPIINDNNEYGFVEVSVSMTEIVSGSVGAGIVSSRRKTPANPFVI